MSVRTLTVAGEAERDVVPDRVVVSVRVQTPVLPSPQAALARCAEARRRLLDDLRAAHPASAIADSRISTEAQSRRVQIETELEGYTEERWEVDGYTGHCLVTLEDEAAAAAAIMASAGTHPDAERVSPYFV
ncbi:MAG: SIMPL domain-containing protein, partial [Chloroflexota bacterium]|nr:SIMPL domain-containing protein [Chloroflexota bacterium]